MKEPAPYKQTLFDRIGPDAIHSARTLVWGAAMGIVFFGLTALAAARYWDYSALQAAGAGLVGGIVVGCAVAYLPLLAGNASEKVWDRMVVSGVSTPYTEQYSYHQALVMQGRLDEALAALEATIAEAESTVDVRIRTAELYTREAKRHDRAAELFREAIRHPKCTAGEEVYSANRLADLLNGPLGQPGRALVELRRLADRYPNSTVGEHARQALRALKSQGTEKDLFGPPDPPVSS